MELKKFIVSYVTVLTVYYEIEIEADTYERAEEIINELKHEINFDVKQTKECKKILGTLDIDDVDNEIFVDSIEEI